MQISAQVKDKLSPELATYLSSAAVAPDTILPDANMKLGMKDAPRAQYIEVILRDGDFKMDERITMLGESLMRRYAPKCTSKQVVIPESSTAWIEFTSIKAEYLIGLLSDNEVKRAELKLLREIAQAGAQR